MLDLFGVVDAHQCISSVESLCVFGEFLLVGYELCPVSLGLDSLVSDKDVIP